MRLTYALCFAILTIAILPVAAQTPEPQEEPEVPATAAEQQEEQPAPAPAPAPAPVQVPTVYYEKLKVLVDGKAEVNGVIQLEFRSTGADAKLISVNVLAKMKAKDIARDIHKEIALAAGNLFKVKLNGKKIEIKRSNKKGPRFALTIIGQSVAGVSVSTKR